MKSQTSRPRFGRKAKVKNGVKCCEKSHMRRCNNQGTQAFLQVITGGKSASHTCFEQGLIICDSAQAFKALSQSNRSSFGR
jgi:hypothetical protein